MFGLISTLRKRFRNLAGQTVTGLADLLYPPECLVCGAAGIPGAGDSALCGACRRLLDWSDLPVCRTCGAFTTVSGRDQRLCDWCRWPRRYFNETIPLGPYKGLLRRLVLRLKAWPHGALASVLVNLLLSHRQQRFEALGPTVITAVPVHWSRRFIRPFDASSCLAESMAQRLGVRLDLGGVIRRRRGQQQRGLSPSRRFANVRGIFAVRPTGWQGERVLLVDDVLTTGATASVIARLLKRAGASYVAVAVIARAEGAEEISGTSEGVDPSF